MSFPKYPSYRQSAVAWIGSVPSTWEVKPLKVVASHNNDVLAENTDPDHEILYVDISGVAAGRGIIDRVSMRFGNAPSRARRLVRDGDIIISTVRTYLKAIARVTRPEGNLVVSTGFAVIRPRSGCDASFLGYALSAGSFMDGVIARSTGASYPAINASELVGLPLCLPPLSEQRAIAAFLDSETAKIDALVAEQERLIELLKEKRQAVISHAVTKGLDPDARMKNSGVAWMERIPAHWSVETLKRAVCTIEQGWSPQCEGIPADGIDEWGVLKVGCVNGGAFHPLENKLLPADLEPSEKLALRAGDLLISRANTRELVGSAAVVPRDFPRLLLCDKLYRLRLEPGRCVPEFICHFLSSPSAREQIELCATGASSSMLNIGQSAVLDLPVPRPPVEEQRRIVAYVLNETSHADKLVTEIVRAIELLRERRIALISAAVTGQIDVRPDAMRTAA